MSKGILVLEWLPVYCSECAFCYEKYNEGSWCDLLNEQVYQWERPGHCPLRELPEKQVRDYPEYDRYITGYDDGWDACINEILGEENMEIIKHGKFVEGRIRCKNCLCMFDYDKDDVVKEKEDIHIIFSSPRTRYTTYVYCPECKEKHIINIVDRYI